MSEPKIFCLKVFGHSVPEARARTEPVYTRSGPLIVKGRVVTKTRTPKETQAWRDLIQTEAQRIVREDGFLMFPEGEALMMSAEFVYLRPKSVSVKKRPHLVVKPDVDNLIKNVKDALSQVAYADDKQVVGYAWPLWKRYALEGEQPHMMVWVYRFDDWSEDNNLIKRFEQEKKMDLQNNRADELKEKTDD